MNQLGFWGLTSVYLADVACYRLGEALWTVVAMVMP